MKISHSQLEECRRRPKEWVAEQLSPDYFAPRGGYNLCLREGIFQFHKTGDRQTAIAYTEQRIRRSLSDGRRIENALQRLEEYIDWYQGSGVVVVGRRINLSLDLGNEVILGGQVSRVDMTAEGYRAILLRAIPGHWDEELRVPLIQRAIAGIFNRPEIEFSVGCQELDASNIEIRSFDRADIDAAEQVARNLARLVGTEWRRVYAATLPHLRGDDQQ